MTVNFKNVTKDTWVRIITLLLVLINLISTSVFGYEILPFGEEAVYQGVSVVLTVLVSFWTTWKNNSFTNEAQTADQYIKEVRELNKK